MSTKILVIKSIFNIKNLLFFKSNKTRLFKKFLPLEGLSAVITKLIARTFIKMYFNDFQNLTRLGS